MVRESWIDDATFAEIGMVMMQQLARKLEEQLQSMVAQLKQTTDQVQQVLTDTKKHVAKGCGRVLLQELDKHPLQSCLRSRRAIHTD